MLWVAQNAYFRSQLTLRTWVSRGSTCTLEKKEKSQNYTTKQYDSICIYAYVLYIYCTMTLFKLLYIIDKAVVFTLISI